MIGRMLHVSIDYFSFKSDDYEIPDQGKIPFNNILPSYYYPTSEDTPGLKLNEMYYDSNTSKVCFLTSSLTQNTFSVYWDVCLDSCLGIEPPTFSLLLEEEDGTVRFLHSSSSTRRSDNIYGNDIFSLPTPIVGAPPSKYYLSLVNTTGASCSLSRRAMFLASLMIISFE